MRKLLCKDLYEDLNKLLEGIIRRNFKSDDIKNDLIKKILYEIEKVWEEAEKTKAKYEQLDKSIRILYKLVLDFYAKVNGYKVEGKYDPKDIEYILRDMYIKLGYTSNRLISDVEKLAVIAYKDPLTQLYNRLFFITQAEIFIENSRRYNHPLCLALFDLDDFKGINDTYGHDIGDLVLKKFADALARNVRLSDIPARLGGDEFALLMPNTELETARVVIQRIYKALEIAPILVNSNSIYIRFSAGIAQWNGENGFQELYQKADVALYESKRMGKNKITGNM